MNENFEEFVLNFFRKLKCDIADDGVGFIIKNIPKSFIDILDIPEPLKISFKKIEDYNYLHPNSYIFRIIEKYLDNAGKTTLLKIDFDISPGDEIKKLLNFKNCSIGTIEKKHKNNFFTRFSFLSVFNYLTEREQLLNEIYVYENRVIEGDLTGYKVIEANNIETEIKNMQEYYNIAKEKLKLLIEDKKKDIENILVDNLNEETKRINEYYDVRLSELGGDLSKQLKKIKELELELRLSDDSKKNELKERIERLQKGLLKIADDDAKNRVLREKEFSVQNAKQKFSLNISNKLINTTAIYYPIYNFKLLLNLESNKGVSSTTSRLVDITYNPLTKNFSELHCESCNVNIREILLCSSGHIVCNNCLQKCEECGKVYCKKCLTKSCSICAKKLCKNCFKICNKCNKYVCFNCLRKDCVTGEDFCLDCLRACSKCHGLTQEKFFGISDNGSKICQKCLASENRNKIIEQIFDS